LSLRLTLSDRRHHAIPDESLSSPVALPKLEALELLKNKAKAAKRRHEAAVSEARESASSNSEPSSASNSPRELSPPEDPCNTVNPSPVRPVKDAAGEAAGWEGSGSGRRRRKRGGGKERLPLTAPGGVGSSQEGVLPSSDAHGTLSPVWLLITLHKAFRGHHATATMLALAVLLAAILSGLTHSPHSRLGTSSAGDALSTQHLMTPPPPSVEDASMVAALTSSSGVPGGEELQQGAVLEAAGHAHEAMGWYRKAALEGSPPASVRMGAMVEAGMDQEEADPAASGRWYHRAATLGLAQGQYELARWVGQNKHCGDLGPCKDNACEARTLPGCTKAAVEAVQVKWWRSAAEQGHTGAQAALGQLLASGIGSGPFQLELASGSPGSAAAVGKEARLQREREALMWLKRAAQGGNTTAMVGLAAMMAEGRGAPRDEAGAVRWLTRAAELGHLHAQYNLGNMIFSGRGSQKDPGLAAQWYRRAADQGHAQAQSNLGSMLAAGEGGTTNAQAAVSLFRDAAKQGEATAQYNLANMLFDGRGSGKDEKASAFWYKSAADQGYGRAQFAYAVVLSEGRGVPTDTAQAVVYYRLAAERGLAEAQFNLGYLLAIGKGVGKNESQAARWFRKAAASGHVNSMFNVGNMYYDGRGLAKNASLAVLWYKQAAAKGHQGAAYNVGVMLESGEGEGMAVDLAGAIHYYTQAADRGMAQAQTALGIMLESGKGTPRDLVGAKIWFRKAAKQGHQGAIARLYSW